MGPIQNPVRFYLLAKSTTWEPTGYQTITIWREEKNVNDYASENNRRTFIFHTLAIGLITLCFSLPNTHLSIRQQQSAKFVLTCLCSGCCCCCCCCWGCCCGCCCWNSGRGWGVSWRMMYCWGYCNPSLTTSCGWTPSLTIMSLGCSACCTTTFNQNCHQLTSNFDS